jgi:hypothetical protein
MPMDRCVIFYQCSSCQAILRPKPGDCCVFCSYGSIRSKFSLTTTVLAPYPSLHPASHAQRR